MEKEKIRPIYSELQGYLSQAPTSERPGDWVYYGQIFEQYNNVIDKLNSISDKDYNRFKVQPETFEDGRRYVRILDYRSKLSGLISKLHGEYFYDEPSPFSGMPTTIISQTQQQTQSFQIQMLLEIQSKIDEKIPKFKEGSKERKFLERIKSSLSSVRDISQLIGLLLKTGKEIGLTLGQLFNIFK